MHIQRIVVKNFRNLKSFDSQIQAGMTCVVGENNSGKSNLLHSIRLALDVNLPNVYRKLLEEDFSRGCDIKNGQQVLVGIVFTDFSCDKDPAKVKESALACEWKVNESLAQVIYRFRPKQSVRQGLESGERKIGDLKIEEYGWELIGGPFADSEGNQKDLADIEWNDESLSCINVRFNSLEAYKLVFLPALRDVEDDLKRLSVSPLFKLIEASNIPESRKNEMVKMVQETNEKLQKEPEFASVSKNINDSFVNTVGPVFKTGISLGTAEASFTGVLRWLRLLVSDVGLSEADVSRNGLGLNNALYISMLLAYFDQKSKEDDTAGQLLLIEEPEAHLHPQLQQVLFRKLQGRNCQIFATSHSTHISSSCLYNHLLVFTRDKQGFTSTNSETFKASLLEPKDISDLERYLDATKSTLLFAKKVVLVEGMSEVFLIPPLVKTLMKCDLEEGGISVIPIHGTHFDVYMKLFGPKGIQKKCAIITDGDLTPSDSESTNDQDLSGVTLKNIEDLKKLENEYVKVFNCETTFEREVAPGNWKMFGNAAGQLGAPRISQSLLALASNQKPTIEESAAGKDKVLNTACRFGKARFAQVSSKFIADAQAVPDYIRQAIEWIKS